MAMNPGVTSAASPDDIMARKMAARRRMTEARGGMGMVRSGQRGPAWGTRTAGAGAETAAAGPAVKPLVKPAPDTTRPNPMLQRGPEPNPLVKPLAANTLAGGELPAAERVTGQNLTPEQAAEMKRQWAEQRAAIANGGATLLQGTPTWAAEQVGAAAPTTGAAPAQGGLQSLVNLGKKQPTIQELVAWQQAQNKPTTRGW
jgi:hypothetical protein